MKYLIKLAGFNFVIAGIFILYIEIFVREFPFFGSESGILSSILISFGFLLAFNSFDYGFYFSNIKYKKDKEAEYLIQNLFHLNDNSRFGTYGYGMVNVGAKKRQR